ncbi:transposase [Streptomyces sp. NPDC006544]|uniref:transposase n=1 Tax=Streptomyces sp. NPDC006544 TaxID=3154583 RepID=UPI0033B54DC5
MTNHRGILNTHLAAGLKRYEAEHNWLTTIRLPAYAPDLNPVEAVWSLVRRATANTAFDTPTTSTAHSAASYAESSSDPTSSTAASPPPAWLSTHRPHPEILSNLSFGSDVLAVVTSKAHPIHVGSLSGRTTGARIRRVMRETGEGPDLPVSSRLSVHRLSLIGSSFSRRGVQLSLRSAYAAGVGAPSTPGPAVSSLRIQLSEGRLVPHSTGSCDRRPHAIGAVVSSRGIIKGSLAFARPAFPSPVAPRWPGHPWT